jgi:hypothetical protein
VLCTGAPYPFEKKKKTFNLFFAGGSTDYSG